MSAAEINFRLDKPDKSGSSRRSALLQFAKTARKRPEELDQGEIPKEGLHLWNWFWELSSGRGSNGFGPLPLAFSEIEAWTRLRGVSLRPREVGIIKRLDRAFLNVMAEA